MAANKIVRIGPVALTSTTTTNLVNPPSLTGGTGLAGTNAGTYLLIKHIRIVNKSSAAASFSLFLGTSGTNAAGTEFMGLGTSVPANSYVDWYGALRLDATEYLVGGASTSSALTFQGEGEIGVA